MTDEMDWGGELSALESRAEVDSLADLQQRRREILHDNARLIALHGERGLFDNRRKQFLEAQKIAARERLTAAGAKITDAIVDAEAHACDEYKAFLDAAEGERVECLLVLNQLSELDERIENRKAALFLYGQEVKLAR